MTAPPTYGPPRSPDELDAFARIAAESFAIPLEEERRYVERNGAGRLRLLRAGDAPIAGLALLEDLGQWYGGRRVDCVGIAAVAVDPRQRGRGAGTTLLRAAVRELHAAGTPLALLYPATQPLYRRAGFERAGARWRVRVAPAALDLRDRALPLRRIAPADRAALPEVRAASQGGTGGGLDRNALLWDRILADADVDAVAIGPDGAIEGFLAGRLDRRDEAVTLHLRDLVARTPAAATRLLTFLADHRHQVGEVVWHGAPDDPLLALPREQQARVELGQVWMLRVVDVEGALRARGYPAGLTASLHLEVFDEVIEANRGRFVLEVDDGRASVRRGGEGRLRVHVRGLAPLYSGWMTPDALACTGLLEGPPPDRSLAAALFAGRAPAMADFF